MTKILIVNPNTTASMTETIGAAARAVAAPGTEISAKFSTPQTSAVSDTLFLGCRIGNSGPRKDRFRGEMDELWVADGALGPREIVELMKFNRPPQTELASVKK